MTIFTIDSFVSMGWSIAETKTKCSQETNQKPSIGHNAQWQYKKPSINCDTMQNCNRQDKHHERQFSETPFLKISTAAMVDFIHSLAQSLKCSKWVVAVQKKAMCMSNLSLYYPTAQIFIVSTQLSSPPDSNDSGIAHGRK